MAHGGVEVAQTGIVVEELRGEERGMELIGGRGNKVCIRK
jgi:hypothetical protein